MSKVQEFVDLSSFHLGKIGDDFWLNRMPQVQIHASIALTAAFLALVEYLREQDSIPAQEPTKD